MKRLTLPAALFFSLLVSATGWGADAPDRAVTGVRDVPKLVVEEYRLAPCSVDSRLPAELPRQLLNSIGEKRKRWRYDQPLSDNVDKINKVIGPRGYRLRRIDTQTQSGPYYDFIEGDSVVLRPLSGIRGFTYDQKTNRFLFTVTEGLPGWPPFPRDWLILDGKPQPWEPSDHEYWPALLADGHLVTYDPEQAGNGFLKAVIRQDSQVVYTGMTRWNVCSSSIDGFSSDGLNWVLEYADSVVVNGSSLNRQLRCNAVFGYNVIHGAPFYLFTRDNKVRMFFGAGLQPYTYDDVKRGGHCGESYYSPMGNDDMVWFYAKRDGWWYYVEAGVYEHTK